MIDRAPSAALPAEAGTGNRLPRRIIMTVDAVGGVWRYAMDLAEALRDAGVETVFAGLGPGPSTEQRRETARIGTLEWLAAPLDWMVDDESGLDAVPALLAELALKRFVDLLHLNLPSQAAGLAVELPVVAVSHSCVATWFDAVRGSGLPRDWRWQKRRNRQGFDRADVVLAPSRSHAAALARCSRSRSGPHRAGSRESMPASPRVARTYATSRPSSIHPAIAAAQPYSRSSGWATTARARRQSSGMGLSWSLCDSVMAAD